MPRRKRRGARDEGRGSTSAAEATPGTRAAWARAAPATFAEVALILFVVAATVGTFSGVAGYSFLNWDDPDALVKNPALDSPGFVAWAFATTHMSHYQPLSWLAWAAARGAFGADARVHHLLSLAAHTVVALLLFLVARVLFARILGGPTGAARAGAAVAALVYALHPLRVEVVAWASAFPYVLSLAFLLLSFLMYWRAVSGQGSSQVGADTRLRNALLVQSFLAYAASLLARPVALAFPLVLLLVDRALGRKWRPSLLEKVPFAVLAVLLGVAEGRARAFVGFEQIGLLPRLTMAVTAPFTYLGRALWPVSLSPLDALPLEPRTAWPALLGGTVVLALALFLAWRWASRHPWPVTAGVSWLVLLAPALGLLPSGLAATADRYTYVPDVALALLVGGAAGAAWPQARPGVMLLAGVVIVGLSAASARQATFWRDSVTLWTRAAALDPRSDVALYNLALALADAGDDPAAAARLRETLALVPDHGPARAKLASIETRGLEDEAARAAEAGRLDEAIELYGRVFERDGARMRARASRGMALLQRGRLDEAISDLTEARRLGNQEATVASVLALALTERGRAIEAKALLEAALHDHREDPGLTHNLARLLATSGEPTVQDAPRAIELALAAQKSTAGRDPRVYDTLAAAYAAAGQRGRARETALSGAALARSLGASDLADALAARARSLK